LAILIVVILNIIFNIFIRIYNKNELVKKITNKEYKTKQLDYISIISMIFSALFYILLFIQLNRKGEKNKNEKI